MTSRSVLAALAGIVALCVSSSSFAAFQAYLQIKGAKQGQFKAASKNAARQAQGWGDVSSLSTYDLGQGMATGRRAHEPLVVRKVIDSTSPLFLRAKQTDEALTVTIEVVQTAEGRTTEQVVERITLTNADVYAIDTTGQEQDVSFRFSQMASVDLKTNKTVIDNW